MLDPSRRRLSPPSKASGPSAWHQQLAPHGLWLFSLFPGAEALLPANGWIAWTVRAVETCSNGHRMLAPQDVGVSESEPKGYLDLDGTSRARPVP